MTLEPCQSTWHAQDFAPRQGRKLGKKIHQAVESKQYTDTRKLLKKYEDACQDIKVLSVLYTIRVMCYQMVFVLLWVSIIY